MAYMSQEKKKTIAADLKAVMPKDWKWTLAVEGHSTIVLTIRSAPVDLLARLCAAGCLAGNHHFALNPYHWRGQLDADAELVEIFEPIFAAMNKGNHDRSDIQSDYHDVGWYVTVQIGAWDRPFKVTQQAVGLAG